MCNAFIIWKKLNPERRDDNLEFRMKLIKTMMQYHLHTQAPANPGPGEPTKSNVYNTLGLIERHFPSQKSQAFGRKKSQCIRCHLIGIRKEVIYECKKCQFTLCIFPCFEIYHTRKNLAEIDDDSEASSPEDNQ